MHCWKTINVKKQYGLERLFLLSSLLVIIVFSFAYVLLGIINDTHKSDDYFLLFTLGFLSIYPLHKLLHYIPLYKFRENLKIVNKKQFGFLPTVSIRVVEPIIKKRFIYSLLAPFIFINLVLIIGALLVPVFSHYFTMLLAYHCGICLIDLIYVKHLSKSPKSAYIEETEAGFEILIAPTHT
ncbi:DUF3267 domain-containing protein [Psychrobacillus sp. NPDC093180]|uniref:DUF3267 domain-containing protein n=1 Tax=Psychrobacillus sp. NPDC093180 TaxID=3364489 RepID=UPI003817841B